LQAAPWLETAIWTPADRALVGDFGFGSGHLLTDDQFRLLEPFVAFKTACEGNGRTNDEQATRPSASTWVES